MKIIGARLWKWLLLVATGSVMLQLPAFTGTTGIGGGGCARFMSNGVLSSLDMCYILDCQNGFFGGVIDPCNDLSAGPILLDCENGGGGGGTTTDDQNTDDTNA